MAGKKNLVNEYYDEIVGFIISSFSSSYLIIKIIQDISRTKSNVLYNVN
jgi:hypothetical protein